MFGKCQSLLRRTIGSCPIFRYTEASIGLSGRIGPCRWPYSTSSRQRAYPERREIVYKKMRVHDYDIAYVEMEGNSDHVVFILPGSLSSIEQDFIPLLQRLDPRKCKAIAYDPPGFGQSRPPNRWEVPGTVAETDAEHATELLRKLGYEKYSLMGWSMGGFSALWMASRYPTRLHKLVVWGVNGYMDDGIQQVFDSMKVHGINSIPKSRLEKLLGMYGEENLKKIFYKWVSGEDSEHLREGFSKDGPFTQMYFNQVQCPTLIIHGGRDKLVNDEHAKYVNEQIKGSKIHVIPAANHLTHAGPFEDEFLKEAEIFLFS